MGTQIICRMCCCDVGHRGPGIGSRGVRPGSQGTAVCKSHAIRRLWLPDGLDAQLVGIDKVTQQTGKCMTECGNTTLIT